MAERELRPEDARWTEPMIAGRSSDDEEFLAWRKWLIEGDPSDLEKLGILPPDPVED